MRPFWPGNKYLEDFFNLIHKNRMFWVNMILHWESLPPKQRKKLLAGAAFGLVLVIIFIALGILLLALVSGFDFFQLLVR